MSIGSGAAATVASAGSAMVGAGASVGATVAFGRAVLRRRSADGVAGTALSPAGIDLASLLLRTGIVLGCPSFPELGSWFILPENAPTFGRDLEVRLTSLFTRLRVTDRELRIEETAPGAARCAMHE